MGRRTWKAAPPNAEVSTQMRPWCASTSPRAIANSRPAPGSARSAGRRARTTPMTSPSKRQDSQPEKGRRVMIRSKSSRPALRPVDGNVGAVDPRRSPRQHERRPVGEDDDRRLCGEWCGAPNPLMVSLSTMGGSRPNAPPRILRQAQDERRGLTAEKLQPSARP